MSLVCVQLRKQTHILMKKPIYQIKIKEPCSENWDGMTDNEIGKFCVKCAKNVVNFEGFSDKKLINYLKDSKSSICGRIETSKLNTDLVLPKETRFPGKVAVAASLLLLASCTGYTQGTPALTLQNPDTIAIPINYSINSNQKGNTSNILRGIVTDIESGKPLEYANITIGKSNYKAISDSLGRFELVISDYELMSDQIEVEIRNFGFSPEYYQFEKSKFPVNQEIEIKMKKSCEILMGDIDFDYQTLGVMIIEEVSPEVIKIENETEKNRQELEEKLQEERKREEEKRNIQYRTGKMRIEEKRSK